MLLSLAGLGMAWIWFCSLILVESIILLFLIENDRPGWSAISLLSTFVLLNWFADVNVYKLAWHNPGTAAIIALGYFIVGTLWSVGKWYLFVKDQRAKYDETKAEWDAGSSHINLADPVKLKAHNEAWKKSPQYCRFLNRRGTLVPLVREHKSRIMTWMGYWPWSMVWTIINDPIKRAFKAIYNRIHNTLQTISNNAFKDVQ